MAATAPVALDPEDWFRATWRKLPPLVRLPAVPFDAAGCLQRLAKVAPAPSYTEEWSWARGRLSPALSPKEASFWLRAMLDASQQSQPTQLAAKWAAAPPTTPLTTEELRKALGRHQCPPPEVWIPLISLLGAVEAVEQVLRCEEEIAGSPTAHWSWYRLAAFISLSRGFQRHVVPYLTEAERAKVRELVQPRMDLTTWPQLTQGPVPLPLLFGAALGFPDEMRTLIRGFSPDDELHRQVHDVLFGLGSRDEVIAGRERLKLPLDCTAHIRGWLAHTEFSALEPLRDAILAEKRKGAATPLIGALGLARGPEAAAIMIELLTRSKAPDAARAWLQRYPSISIPVLLEAARGRGKAAGAALSLLRSLGAKGLEAEIVQSMGAECPSRVREALAFGRVPETSPLIPAWMKSAAGNLTLEDGPAWISVRELPAVTVDGDSFPDSAVTLLLAALSVSALAAPHPLVAAARANADPHTLDLFAWRLYELWRQHGMKNNESWALAATGLLGGDGCALKLGPLARELRSALRHEHAALVLECLKAIGTDTALLQLRNFTRIPREWSLKAAAAQHLEAIAAARGLSMEQLEDRMVPICGLDERGSCVYDYGPRAFTLVMGSGLKPVVLDGVGRTRELPKPGTKDDPAKAPAAYAAWGVLKKQLADVARMQSRRLELAMIDGRRWNVLEFEEALVRHPVMTHFARGLVWGAYSDEGVLQDTFRVAEDHSCAGPDDTPFVLPPSAQIGLPHPLSLRPELIEEWGERFSDYEITPPFPQLARPVFTPQAAERAATEDRSFAGIPCLAAALVDGLERRGWRREDDGRYTCRFRREFPAPGVVAIVEIAPGFTIWDIRSAQDQTVESVSFYPSEAQDRIPGHRLPFKHAPPIAFSEVTSDLSDLVRPR